MAALVGVLVFMSMFLSFVTGQANLTHAMSEQAARPRMASQSAQQELAFYQACSSFLQGFGAPANGQYIQVSDLVASHLLPTSFPAVTPFGQTLQGWPVLNPSNALITNLYVFPTGAMNPDALVAAGYGRFSSGDAVPAGVVNMINQSVYSAVLAGLPSASANMNTQSLLSGMIATSTNANLQLTGPANTVLVADTGISNTAMVGVRAAPAIVSVAPNQLGYTVIGFSSYGNYLPWNAMFPTAISGSLVTQESLFSWADNIWGTIHLNLMGWSPTCPPGASLLSSGMAATQDTRIDYNATQNASLSGEFCIQTYRTEGLNVKQSIPLQVDAYRAVGALSSSVNYLVNGGSGTTSGNTAPSMFTQAVAGTERIGSNQSVGMITYATSSGSVSNPWSLPYVSTGLLDATPGGLASQVFNGTTYNSVEPQNNLWDHTIPVWAAATAVNLIALQPNGASSSQVNTYQIAFAGYQITTGTGASWADLNLPTPVSSDSASGWAGWTWVNGLSIWRGYACPSATNLNDNVLSTNCSRQSPLGTSNVTYGTQIHASVTSGAVSSDANFTNLLYQYNPGSGNASETFTMTVPASLVTTVHY